MFADPQAVTAEDERWEAAQEWCSAALRRVADIIEATPKGFDMRALWRCGTVCCIAGWAVGNAKGLRTNDEWIAAGADALGITLDQANILFFAENWPEPFAEQYEAAEEEIDKAESGGGADGYDTVAECRAQAVCDRAMVAVRLLRAIAAGEVVL